MAGKPIRKDKAEIVEALKRGEMWKNIVSEFKVPVMTISRYKREYKISNRYKNTVA